MNEFVNEYKKKGENVLDNIQDMVFPGKTEIEGTGYERSPLDRRVEKYLDEHFDEYIEEFGLVRELDFEILESEFDDIKDGLTEIDEFQKEAKSNLVSLERRLSELEDKI